MTNGTSALIVFLAMLGSSAMAQTEDYTWMINADNSVTITGYTGGGGAVTIPSTINGLPVRSIGNGAFYYRTTITNITIPNSVTLIGIGAFNACTSLTSVTIPDSVTMIWEGAFYYCTNLMSVTIGDNVINIGGNAFAKCPRLASVYFKGNTPYFVTGISFSGDNNTTVYYLPGTTGWGPTFEGRPTALWVLPNPVILNTGPSFGVKTNQFGFVISWATNVPVVVEAATNTSNAPWSPIATNTLNNGSVYFSDPQWTNYPARFYRVRSP